MKEYKKLKGLDQYQKATQTTIFSGMVIVEQNKVLLVKHGNDGYWKFPGGAIKDSFSVLESMMKDTVEETGLAVKLERKEPFVYTYIEESTWVNRYFILIHYEAKLMSDKIIPGENVRDWDWFDINILPIGSAPNIKPTLETILKIELPEPSLEVETEEK